MKLALRNDTHLVERFPGEVKVREWRGCGCLMWWGRFLPRLLGSRVPHHHIPTYSAPPTNDDVIDCVGNRGAHPSMPQVTSWWENWETFSSTWVDFTQICRMFYGTFEPHNQEAILLAGTIVLGYYYSYNWWHICYRKVKSWRSLKEQVYKQHQFDSVHNCYLMHFYPHCW